MDDPDHGVLVTIIDLGLARMDAHAGVHWTPFDEETFEGEGDYQFDVYRMMRAHNGDEWTAFRPLTNVMVSPPPTPTPRLLLLSADRRRGSSLLCAVSVVYAYAGRL